MITFLEHIIQKQDFSAREVVELVTFLRGQMNPAPALSGAIDTCGTGGDYLQTLNASTMAAFVCAAAGVKVAKHGGRAATSKCGSFDLLEALGVNINITNDQITECFSKTGLAFLFAPAFHPTFKEVAPMRKALGRKTIFNYIGPLLNPALVKRQVIGVSDARMPVILGEALMQLGSERIVIVRGLDGLDEASISGPSEIFLFERDSQPRQFRLDPPELFSIDEVRGGEPAENARRTLRILQGHGTPAENLFVTLNSALALFVVGKADSIDAGIARAQEIVKSGVAYETLQKIVTLTNNI